MSEKLAEKLRDVSITENMFATLEYNGSHKPRTTHKTPGYTAMFVFQRSDLDAAAYHLAKSFEDPFNSRGICNIFVEEICLEAFKEKLKKTLRPFPADILDNSEFVQAMQEIIETLEKINAQTIQPLYEQPAIVPTIVCDFGREYYEKFGQIERRPLVPSLKSFRTVKEAISLTKLETSMDNATIWSENHSKAYEIVASCSFHNYFLNCFDVPLEALNGTEQSCALIENMFHYEQLVDAGARKKVVFPVGTTFAN